MGSGGSGLNLHRINRHLIGAGGALASDFREDGIGNSFDFFVSIRQSP